MTKAIVDVTLATTISGTELYLSHGKKSCIKRYDLPSSFSESSPADISVKANNGGSCASETSKIHLYIWADEEQTIELVEFELYSTESKNYFNVDVMSIVQGYNLNYSNPSESQYTLTLVSDGSE